MRLNISPVPVAPDNCLIQWLGIYVRPRAGECLDLQPGVLFFSRNPGTALSEQIDRSYLYVGQMETLRPPERAKDPILAKKAEKRPLLAMSWD